VSEHLKIYIPVRNRGNLILPGLFIIAAFLTGADTINETTALS
jgi:hypothetical protein